MASQRFRTTEALFATIPVADIRVVLRGKQSEIDGKKQQLRELVGSHYHDLVQASDAIVELDVGAKGVLKTLPALREVRCCRIPPTPPVPLRAHHLGAHSPTSPPPFFPAYACMQPPPFLTRQLLEDFAVAAAQQRALVKRAAELRGPSPTAARSWLRRAPSVSLAPGSAQRGLAFVKLLLNASESVWSDIESGQVIDAAVALLMARRACVMLESGAVQAPARVAAWAPQQRSLRHFPTQLDAKCAALLSTPGLTAEQCAGALAARVLLGRLPLPRLVAAYLEGRTQWVVDALAASTADDETLSNASARLSRLVTAVHDTIVHAAQLFPPAPDAMLPAVLNESALRIGTLGRPNVGGGSDGTAEVWAELARSPQRTDELLNAEMVKNECTSWLESQLQRIWKSDAVLAGVSTMHDMAILHERVYDDAACEETKNAESTLAPVKTKRRSGVGAGPTARRDHAGDAMARVETGGEPAWPDAFNRVIFRGAIHAASAERGLRTARSERNAPSLWPLLFAPTFDARVVSLLKESLQLHGDAMVSALRAKQQQQQRQSLASAGSGGGGGSAATLGGLGGASSARVPSDAAAAGGGASQLRGVFDGPMAQVLRDVSAILAREQANAAAAAGGPSSSSSSSSSGGSSRDRDRDRSRARGRGRSSREGTSGAPSLRDELHDAGRIAVRLIIDELGKLCAEPARLEGRKRSSAADDAACAEAQLVAGQLCWDLAHNSKALVELLPPSSLDSVRATLDAHSTVAVEAWAQQNCDSLSGALRNALEDHVSAETETLVTLTGGSRSMTTSTPSTQAAMFLLHLCQKLRSACEAQEDNRWAHFNRRLSQALRCEAWAAVKLLYMMQATRLRRGVDDVAASTPAGAVQLAAVGVQVRCAVIVPLLLLFSSILTRHSSSALYPPLSSPPAPQTLFDFHLLRLALLERSHTVDRYASRRAHDAATESWDNSDEAVELVAMLEAHARRTSSMLQMERGGSSTSGFASAVLRSRVEVRFSQQFLFVCLFLSLTLPLLLQCTARSTLGK